MQILGDRARGLTSNAERTIDRGARKRTEVRDDEHGWGVRPTYMVVVWVR